MEIKEITKIVCEECRRLESKRKTQRETREAFETAPVFDEIPHELQKCFEFHNFFYEGPEVTTPADEFVHTFSI
jgi:hypothetical protein